jgi:hypothetical protein
MVCSRSQSPRSKHKPRRNHGSRSRSSERHKHSRSKHKERSPKSGSDRRVEKERVKSESSREKRRSPHMKSHSSHGKNDEKIILKKDEGSAEGGHKKEEPLSNSKTTAPEGVEGATHEHADKQTKRCRKTCKTSTVRFTCTVTSTRTTRLSESQVRALSLRVEIVVICSNTLIFRVCTCSVCMSCIQSVGRTSVKLSKP